MWIEIFIGVTFAAPVWLMVCNNRTYRERGKLIEEAHIKAVDKIAQGELISWQDEYEPLDRVSYNQHLWYRLTLRNPKRLYKL